MKNLHYFLILPITLHFIALFIPYIEHQYEPGVKILERGTDFGFAFVPLSIMIIIALIASIKRSRFTAIIAFVLCFGLLFSLFLLQFSMRPMLGDFTIHTYKFGYILAFLSALLLMVLLLVNLVKVFRSAPKKE